MAKADEMMVPSNSASTFRQFLHDRQVDFQADALDEIIAAVLDFYGTVDALGLIAEPPGDMLLFQFGTYDWGHGEHFEFDITRQFIVADQDDDDAISQLHCTLYYEPSDALKSIGNGNRWCRSRDELAEFRTFILSSEAYMAAQPLPAQLRRIEWDPI